MDWVNRVHSYEYRVTRETELMRISERIANELSRDREELIKAEGLEDNEQDTVREMVSEMLA